MPIAEATIAFHHYGIGEDCSHRAFGVTDGDNRPVFVSPKLREREAARHLHSVLVLRGNGPAAAEGALPH